MRPLHALILLAACLPFSASGERRPNVLLICIDDLRPELRCFGVDYVHSPHIDSLAAAGRAFTRHYVQAPTCGASRYTLLTGRYGPRDNGALFQRAGSMVKNPSNVTPSLPSWFQKHGYATVSVGKVSHHPGGRGGADWDDDNKPEMPGSWTRHRMPSGSWRHPRGAMHGLANGEIRAKAGDMDVFQSHDGPDAAYPDGLITDEALRQLDILASAGKPFFLAAGIIRPHLPFGAPARYMEPYAGKDLPPVPHPDKPAGKTTWHGSNEFMKYNRWENDPRRDASFSAEVRRHYAACVTYADAMVGRLIAGLERHGLRDNTIVAVWGDHGWHLGEHAVWGKHTLFEESLRSPLIIVAPGVRRAGEPSPSIVETIDIYPTLCELAGLEAPRNLHGISLGPILRDPAAPGHAAVSYKNGSETIRTGRHRLIHHGKGSRTDHIELYDHQTDPGEESNIAGDTPVIAESLLRELTARLRR